MDEEELMEVYFHEYCNTCKYENLEERKDPCEECLSNPSNVNSHKPVNWKEKDS